MQCAILHLIIFYELRMKIFFDYSYFCRIFGHDLSSFSLVEYGKHLHIISLSELSLENCPRSIPDAFKLGYFLIHKLKLNRPQNTGCNILVNITHMCYFHSKCHFQLVNKKSLHVLFSDLTSNSKLVT